MKCLYNAFRFKRLYKHHLVASVPTPGLQMESWGSQRMTWILASAAKAGRWNSGETLCEPPRPSWWWWGKWLWTGVCLLVSWRNFPVVQRVCACRTSSPKTGAETKANTFVKGQFPRWPYATFLFLCYNYTSPWLFSKKLKLKPRTPLRGSNGSRGKETQIHKRNLDILWDPKM